MGTLRPLLGTLSTAQGLRRLLRAPARHRGGGVVGIGSREIGDNIFRLGVVYGGCTAATYNGSGTLTALGQGEVRFHKIRHDGDALIDLDEADDATKAFSLMPAALADGQEVLCLYDPTITDPDDETVPQEGWVIFQLSSPPARRGYGVFKTQRDTSVSDTGLFYLPSVGTELFNSDDTNPVVAAELDGAGPNFRALVVDEPGIYRVTFGAELVYLSPAEPTAPHSYQNLIGTVTAGLTEDLCGSFHFRQERVWLFKNADFGSPTAADGILMLEPWNLYFCSLFKRFVAHTSIVLQLDVGDTLSIWQDHGGAVGSSFATVVAHFSVHLSSAEDLEA